MTSLPRSRRIAPCSRLLWLTTISMVLWSIGCLYTHAFEWKDWLNKSKSSATVAIEWAAYHSGIGEQCLFVDKLAQTVRDHLQTHLKGQDHAIEAVVAALESWEFTRSKHRTPLVLAITGPTGTGKTEMSNLLAESVFKRMKKLKNSEKQVPTGLLVFRGEDFSDNFTNPITAYHTQIKTRLAEHLHHCSGKSVVLFDEVQKVIPHTLDVLMEAVSERARLSYYKNGVTKTIDTSNVIFVFVSDIGVKEMEHVMLQHATREAVPINKLEIVVKAALDQQWKRLNFGKMIDQVIPFLPFEQPNIAEIIELKLNQLDTTYRGLYWRRLWVQAGIPNYLSRLDSVIYKEYQVRSGASAMTTKVYARYGARTIETGPLQLLKSKLLRYLRPFNKDAEVQISMDPHTKEITIVSCAEDNPDSISPDAPPQSRNPDASNEDNQAEFDRIGWSCVTKWQGSFE